MKKFLLTLMTLVIVVVSAVGCGESGAGSAGQTPTESDWIEVCKIEAGHEYKSTLFYDMEFDDSKVYSKDEVKLEYCPYEEDFPLDRAEFIKNIKQPGTVRYGYDSPYTSNRESGYKYTVRSYTLGYVKVRFLESNCLEINYYQSRTQNITIRLLVTEYKITYFND